MTLYRWPAAAAIALAFLALAAAPAQGQAELMGPLRIRDMTPFSLLCLSPGSRLGPDRFHTTV
ncbi:MAG TPA: hypothetical protein VKK31_11930 [Thermoanaerobaculia bacterium]|nr:hypothetical protein [Thermoanaerobaculia bacterium]